MEVDVDKKDKVDMGDKVDIGDKAKKLSKKDRKIMSNMDKMSGISSGTPPHKCGDLKDKILQILEINKELIKDSFSIGEDGVANIIDILKKDHENFKQVVDDVFFSDMEIREKMVMCYLMGYVNGERKEKLMSNRYKISDQL